MESIYMYVNIFNKLKLYFIFLDEHYIYVK